MGKVNVILQRYWVYWEGRFSWSLLCSRGRGKPLKVRKEGSPDSGKRLCLTSEIYQAQNYTLQWCLIHTMITRYKSRGKPLKVREEGSTVWLLYIFCWKDLLHFKVNDLVSEGGSLLKFEGRISGDPANWLIWNDFRKESFFARLSLLHVVKII